MPFISSTTCDHQRKPRAILRAQKKLTKNILKIFHWNFPLSLSLFACVQKILSTKFRVFYLFFFFFFTFFENDKKNSASCAKEETFTHVFICWLMEAASKKKRKTRLKSGETLRKKKFFRVSKEGKEENIFTVVNAINNSLSLNNSFVYF